MRIFCFSILIFTLITKSICSPSPGPGEDLTCARIEDIQHLAVLGYTTVSLVSVLVAQRAWPGIKYYCGRVVSCVADKCCKTKRRRSLRSDFKMFNAKFRNFLFSRSEEVTDGVGTFKQFNIQNEIGSYSPREIHTSCLDLLINPPTSSSSLERTIMPGLSHKPISTNEVMAHIEATDKRLWGDDVLQGFIKRICIMTDKLSTLDPIFGSTKSCSLGIIRDAAGNDIGYRIDYFLKRNAYLRYKLKKRTDDADRETCSPVKFGAARARARTLARRHSTPHGLVSGSTPGSVVLQRPSYQKYHAGAGAGEEGYSDEGYSDAKEGYDEKKEGKHHHSRRPSAPPYPSASAVVVEIA